MGDLGSVMVIGGCGLLGHHIVKRLLETGDATSITVFDIAAKDNQSSDSRVKYITGNLVRKDDVLSALKKTNAEVIFSTASPNPVVPVPRLLEEVNITGTQNILDCAMECGVKAFVYTSSSSLVQNSYEDIHFVNETQPLPEKPVDGTDYPRTKKIGEKLALTANGQNGLLTVAIRPCSMFGEGDQSISRNMFNLAETGKAKYRIGSGKNLFDFIYIGNAADGHILAAKKLIETSRATKPIPPELRVDGEAFFLTNDNPWAFGDFALFMASEIGKPIAEKDIWIIPLGLMCFFVSILEWITWIVTFGGQPALTTGMIRYSAEVRTFDISKAKKRLGYRPRVEMKDALRRTIAWQRTEALNKKARFEQE